MADGNPQTFTNFIRDQPEDVRMDIFYNIILAMNDGQEDDEFNLRTNETKYQNIYIKSDAYGKDKEEEKKKRRRDAVRLINDIDTTIEHIMHEINHILPHFNAPFATVDDIVGITDMLVNIIEDENNDFAEANYPEDPDDGLAVQFFVFFTTRVRELLNMRRNLQKMVDDFNSYYARMAITKNRKARRAAQQLGMGKRRTKTRKGKNNKSKRSKTKGKTRKNRRK